MEKESPMNELGYMMKAWIASETSINSNFADLSFRNGAIDTNGIMTLADYLKKDRPEKLKNYNPELRDDNKLMRTYVVPVTLPNGMQLDLVVNSKGQDIAQIYVDEVGANRFHLDDKVKQNIANALGAVDTKLLQNREYTREFLPKDVEELAEKISKDELVPKSEENIKERKAKVDSQRMAGNEEDERTPEEIAEEAGIPLSALEKFCEENEIDINSITGSASLQKTNKLDGKMEKELDAAEGETIYALRISGVDGKTTDTLGLIREDGITLDLNSGHDDLLERLVPEGYNGDIDTPDELMSGEIIKIHNDITGKEQEFEIDPANQGDAKYLEEQIQKMKDIVDAEIARIDSDTSLTPVEKQNMRSELLTDEYARVCGLERETGSSAGEFKDQLLATAKEEYSKAQNQELANTLTGGVFNKSEDQIEAESNARTVGDDAYDRLINSHLKP